MPAAGDETRPPAFRAFTSHTRTEILRSPHRLQFTGAGRQHRRPARTYGGTTWPSRCRSLKPWLHAPDRLRWARWLLALLSLTPSMLPRPGTSRQCSAPWPPCSDMRTGALIRWLLVSSKSASQEPRAAGQQDASSPEIHSEAPQANPAPRTAGKAAAVLGVVHVGRRAGVLPHLAERPARAVGDAAPICVVAGVRRAGGCGSPGAAADHLPIHSQDFPGTH